MKAEDIFGKKNGQIGELSHKLRTVTDLIRHIKTKEESSPANYSIFLGAGASVTSEIKTAGQLTDEWANELYERFKHEKSENPEAAKSFFEKEHPSWYNSEHSYSSLFEKKFDLPIQRRRFVEQEVDNKLPSIGYAYLVSLVDGNYFNTIFTTNFDDLINEAFYLFSNKRPIVCAHDSSIRSVSITSKRPKIVKLHGDYLFDDIKSTLRETESLEQNTKEKFVEFCKEYGLIVVGYSGCDRSIMDVLEFLVKQENYLKNGIYWCLRPGDEVCHNLRNLIWKDKVYPVLIDGFDELFAEIHSQTIHGELKLNSSTKQSKLEITIKKIVEDKNNLAKNSIIDKEINSIKEDGNSKDISGFIKQLSQANESSRISTRDVRNLLEIESMTEEQGLQKSLEVCELHYKNSATPIENKLYIEKFIDIYMKLGDDVKTAYWCDKLIELDPNEITYHLNKALSIKKLQDRASFYVELSINYSFNTSIRNHIANTLIRMIRQNKKELQKNVAMAKEHLQKSLSIDPSLDNPAWEISVELATLLYKISENSEIKKGYKEEVSEIINAAKARNPEHRQTIEILEAQLSINCTKAELIVLIDHLIDLIGKSSLRKKKYISQTLCKAFDHAYRITENGDLKLKITKYFESKDLEENLLPAEALAKIKYLHVIAGNTNKADEELRILISQKKIGAYVSDILDLPTRLRQNDLDLLESKLIADKHELNQDYYYQAFSEIQLEKKDYSGALKSIESAYSEGLSLSSYLSKITYILLKSENYNRVISITKQNISNIDESDSDSVIINSQAAAKKIDHESFNAVILRNLIARSSSEEVKLCAFSLLDQHPDARRILKKQLDMDSGLEKRYRDWPALNVDYFSGETLPESI